MVRLMRWMIGFIITSLSSSLRTSQYSSSFSASGKLRNQRDLHGPPPLSDDGNRHLYDEAPGETFPLASKGISPLRHLMELPNDTTCIPPAIDDFPPDFFTQEQRTKGGLILHFVLGIYACYGLAAICDTYFVPSLQLISDRMGLSSDVAGATFMAAGTSSPEFFESIIGSFITEGDIGVGTIVGSAVFNILAVTSVCGLLAGKMVPLDWWPLSRDCAFYAVSVVALVAVIIDEKVYWYEAMCLVIMFLFYVLMMRFNTPLKRFFKSLPCCSPKESQPVSPSESPTLPAENGLMKQTAISIVNGVRKQNGDVHLSEDEEVHTVSNVLLDEKQVKPVCQSEDDDEEDYFKPTHFPDGCLKGISYIITYPINLVFFLTVPNCSRPGWERFYPLTFFMSVVYIGSLSYFVAWMVTIIGYTVGVPDTVMGITFLAIGTSVPEAYSSVIVCRKGMGNMAISNSVGSNVFDILFCLGLPWLIKAAAFSSQGYVQINSSGLVYSAMSLLATVVLLYGVIALFKFQLNMKVGITCLLIYSAFLIFASLVEMNIFGVVNPPSCTF